jgi:excisionase family DNA binding protein
MPITYTLTRAAQECGLSLRTLQYAIERGELESLLIGRRRLIPARSLEEFLFRKKRPAAAQQAKRVG